MLYSCLYNIRKYISVNAMAIAGFIFARDWVILFTQYFNLNYHHESYEDIGVLMAILFTYVVSVVLFLILSLAIFIEFKLRKNKVIDKQQTWVQAIHLLLVLLGILLFITPIILITGAVLLIIILNIFN